MSLTKLPKELVDNLETALDSKQNASELGDAAFADILGIVSQSGGVPTGAIIERGSNASGKYVKFADGTMICIGVPRPVDVNIATGSFFRGVGDIFSWPSQFSVLDFAIHQCTSSTNIWGGPYINTTESVYRARLFSSTSATNQTSVSVGIGRWD